MSKKTIIISIASVILIGIVVVVVLLLLGVKPGDKNSDGTTRQPGDTVAIADTPDFKTCELVSTESIQSVLGDDGQSLSSGEREGVVSHNLESADVCNFTFTASGSVASQLTFQTYKYAAGDATDKSNIFDSSWQNIGSFNYPAYTLADPTYYKKVIEGSDTKFILQILSGPRHYQFAITQPSSLATFTDELAINTLTALAMAADYSVANDENAPPAPGSSTAPTADDDTTPESTEESAPDGKDTDDPNGGVGDS